MSWASQNTDELRLHASRVFNKHYLVYCSQHADQFPGKVTDETFAEHLRVKTGFDIAGTTFRQYRNGSRFQVQFYAVISFLFNVPLAQFLLPEPQAEADFNNQLYARFTVINDMSNNKVAAILPSEQAKMLGLTPETKALVVTNHNSGSRNLSLGNIALVDCSVRDVSISGDYVLLFKDAPTIVTIQRTNLDDEVMLKLDNDGQLETEAINTKNMRIVGKVIGRIG